MTGVVYPFQGPPPAPSLAQSIALAQLTILQRIEDLTVAADQDSAQTTEAAADPSNRLPSPQPL
jgi:hypothetical protein